MLKIWIRYIYILLFFRYILDILYIRYILDIYRVCHRHSSLNKFGNGMIEAVYRCLGQNFYVNGMALQIYYLNLFSYKMQLKFFTGRILPGRMMLKRG